MEKWRWSGEKVPFLVGTFGGKDGEAMDVLGRASSSSGSIQSSLGNFGQFKGLKFKKVIF